MFTGIDAPYEAPESPEIRIHSERESPEDSVGRIVTFLRERGRLA